MSISTLTLRATEAAIKSAGILPHQEQAPPQTIIGDLPAPTDVGWLVADTASALLAVRLRVDPRRRTTYLVIDRATAPLTGNYVIEINVDGDTYAYNATSEAPADVDALLAGIAAKINDSVGAIVEADAYAMTSSGALDAVRLRSTIAAGTHDIGADTSFPGAADLTIYGELNTASTFDLYARVATEIDPGMSGAPPYVDAASGWVLVQDIVETLPSSVVPSGGYLQRIDVAGLAAIYPVIDGTLPDEEPGVIPIAYITVAPARTA